MIKLMALFIVSAFAQNADVMVSVNGTPIRRVEAIERTWKLHGTSVLNQMADEILVRQAAKQHKVKADPKEVDARYKRLRDQFPDDATFRARLEANGSSPETLKASIEEQVLREALVTKAKDIKVSDADVKSAFEANKDKLATPESVKLRHILVAGEKEARDFLLALRAGADFAKLAAQVSQDAASKPRGGDLGFISKGIVIPEIEKAAFALKPGEVSEPVKTPLGWHLLKVDEVRAATPARFDDVKKDLRTALLADRIEKAWPAYLKELRDKAKYETPSQPAATPTPGK